MRASLNQVHTDISVQQAEGLGLHYSRIKVLIWAWFTLLVSNIVKTSKRINFLASRGSDFDTASSGGWTEQPKPWSHDYRYGNVVSKSLPESTDVYGWQ